MKFMGKELPISRYEIFEKGVPKMFIESAADVHSQISFILINNPPATVAGDISKPQIIGGCILQVFKDAAILSKSK